LQAAATPELIGGLVILGLIALIPPAVKRYGAMRSTDAQAKAAPTLPSPASGGG